MIKPCRRYQPPSLSFKEYLANFKNRSGELWLKNPNECIRIFNELREHHPPVLRHFFREKHKTPMSWFTMRLNFSRSVATTSIVGHILGLGDRHTSNILIDNKTGEVVHIDLGIAFEQVRLLSLSLSVLS